MRKIELDRERDKLRAKIEEARAVLDGALGFEEEDKTKTSWTTSTATHSSKKTCPHDSPIDAGTLSTLDLSESLERLWRGGPMKRRGAIGSFGSADPPVNERLLSVKEAAERVGVSPSWLYQSSVPHVKFNRRRLYQPSDLARYVAAHVSHGTQPEAQ